MKKFKFSALFSIVLISLLIVGAVSATDTDGVIGIDDVGADDYGILTIDDSDEVITADGDSGDNRVEKTLTNLEDDIQAGNDVKLENDTQTSDIANVESDPILGIDAKPGTFTDLQAQIEEADGGRLVLPYNFAYDPEYDGENFPDGIIIDSNMYIVGSGYTISGSDSIRIFKVTDNSFLQISDVTLTNGAADNGGAVFVDHGSSFTSLQTTFTNNVAVYRGGAVYSEGFVDIYYSVLDGNDVTYRAQNQLNGGAAIYVKNSFLTLLDTRIINNGKNFKYRTTEDEERDLLESAVTLVDSSATVRNCLFKNNSACYGGALSIINQDDTLDELTVTNSNFIDNRAYNGAGINIGDSAFNIDKCNFINNQAIGIGSPGYVSVGGGVAFDGAKSEGNIKDSNFTGNGANIGGAIYSGTDDAEHTAVVSGCNFNDNTAIEQGGAIVHVGFLSVSDSNFSGNEAPQGNSIYNGGTLSLDGNVIEDDWGIYLSQNGKMTSEVIITINDNKTYNFDAFTPFTVNAKVTDDNGNIIRTYNDKIGIWCGPSVISGSSPGKLTFNEETGLYEADIEIFKTGQIYMGNTRATFPYADSSLITQKIAYVTVIPVNRLLEVTYENITYPGIVTVNVKLSRNGTPVNQAVKITIAGETKSITPKNGVGSTTFEGLAPGIYEIKATVAANAQYNAIEQLYELAVTPIKGTYTDLQYQIDNAIDGALNLAYNFTYNTSYDGDNFPEGVVITSDLTINGNGYSICGNDSYRIFKVIEGVTLTLNNLTICHGAADDGAGVYVDAGATLNADHVKFIYNNATNRGGAIYSEGTVNINNSLLDNNDITNRAINGNGGAAIFMKNGDLTLLNSNVTNNVKDIVVRNNGGDLISAAVELLDSSATVKGSLFKNNSACYGGAINVNGQNDAATLDVDSCTFIDNFAYNGAGIDINSATFNVKNSTFKGNEVRGTGSAGTLNSCGGAIAMGGDKTTGIINNCTFEENFAEYTGGAILIGSGISNDAQILINDSVFIKNRVLSTTNRGKNLGGAIRDEHYGTIVANSTFKENYANYEGGAIYYNNQYSLTDSCVFEDNEANYMGGAIYYNQYNNKINNSEFSKNIATTNNGGAIALVQARTLSIDNSKFTENEANSGGAIYNGALTITNTSFTSNVARSTSGGAINAYGASTITDSNFTSNSAKTTGGAIWLGNQAHTNIKNSKFDMNTAGSNGGALWANANVGMVYSNFTSNKAVANGGAIYTQKALNIDNGVFDENSAKLGGAIYDNGNLILTDSTLTGNNATQGAAVYIVKAKQATISISEFTDNNCNENSHSIYNDGTLALSRNTISNAIYNNLGTITTQTYTVVLNNETKVVSDAPVTIDVVVLDDNNNKITGFDAFNMTVLIDSVGYKANATLSDEYVYEVAFTPEALGNYLVSANYSGITGLTNNVLKTGILRNIKGTYTDLAGKITDAILYHDGVLNLTYDFAYTPEIDEVYIEGILIQGTSLLTVNGNNHTISGSKLAGIFNIQLENATTFNNITFANAYAGAVLTTSKLIVNNCAFINNTDYYDGGYDEGGAISSFTGELVITDSVFINNTARDGGAIDVEGANVTLTNCVFTDNKAVGDGIDSGTGGAISAGNEEQTLTVNNCVFTNNIASTSAVSPEYAPKGGAISSSGHVIINNSNFTNNSADYGGAIEFAFASAEISNSNFTDNTAVYRGGAIYSESTLNVDHCVFDKNDITFRTRNDDNGGAAIYNLNGTLTINNTNITNSVKDILIRNGNAGDLLVGVVVTSGDTLINNSYFANNTGSWGGAISSLGYMNNNPYTLTVENTKFEGNNATFGGAIFVESSELVVDNCTFENNKGVGVGSSGTSNTQGGAIVVFPSGAKASITNSTFIANSANTGGAVSFAGVDQDSLIDNCTFTDNTASDGGAVYLWTGGDAVVTVKDSDFSGNTAEWGNAISNDGKLALSNNTISSTSADIGDYYGVIVSEINVVVLNNMTVDFIDEVLITAKVTDDNNNLIKDINFDFDINGTIVHAVFNSTSGLYQGTYTNDVLGVYVANMTYPVEENLIVKTATLRNIKGTFTDLQAQIDAAEDFGLLFLPYDFTYNEAIDGDNFPDGVIIDSNMYIIGNEFTISGNGSHRIFRVTNGSVFKIDDVTLRDGVADKGGAVYVDEDSFYNSQNAVFTNNTAVYRGGAIYSEGIVDIYDSVLDDNDVTYRSRNDDNGGAAVYNMNGTLVILNSNITNNLRNITVRDGNKGDLLVGVVVTSGYTYISDSYFANNTGSWGGAITSLGYLNSEDYTLNVVNTRFEGNNATFGGAIFVESSELVVDNCTFENNRGVGVGSSGTSNTQGGAIVVFPSGAKATITDSTFIANSANSGGAVSLAGVDLDSLIDNCTFTDNTASDGGAVYLWTAGDAVVTVKDSDFSGNAADWGNAISSDGNLALSNNTVSTTSADIANYNGVIISEINVVILNNETVPFNGEILVTAKVTDDNDNLIRDINFEFVINETVLPAVFNTTSNLYQATYTNDVAGIYVANMTYPVEENFIVKTATLRNIKGTYTDLQAQIDAAGETLVLPYDFAYTESIDGDRFPDGVIISKTISIDGNGFTICGNDSYRIFDVIAGTLTLNNVTVCHGNASQGAGVYVCSGASLVADGVTFTDNTANTKGGAIYSEGDVTVKNSEIDSNDIATRKGPASADNGGAAIYNSKGTLYVENTNITNNLKNITIRNGNAGDLIDGAIVTSGETIIIDSYIANNTGSYGGAITSTGYANDQPYTLTVTGTTFEGNNATFGGAIFVESGVLVVDDCDFIENAGVGVGSSGTSNTQGGAIVVFPNDAKATITNSRFNKNGANLGGAVSLAGIDQDSLIDNCTFTDNTASSEGGAVYLWTQGDASVMIEDSEFSGNTAPWGNAISNDGILELSNNTVSTTSADIANYYGVITSEINAIILNNETVPFNGEILVTAKVTDDNDNLIRDINFEFVINETVLPAVFNTTSNLYQATYTNDVAGIYVANITYIDDENLKVKTATLRNIKGTYTDLAGKITDAIINHDGVLNLTYDFAYTPEIDEVYIEGIIIQGTSLLTVNGNNHTISGSKLAGIFNIQLENTVTFNNVTFANAYAGAVLTTSKLIINNCAFINNTDYYDGGYDEGGAISSFTGELVITDSVFINNTARDGGAIDVEGANVTLTNCIFTDNKAVGDGIDSGTGGAISTGNEEQTLTVNNCVFTNNIASTSAVSPEYAPNGGAISTSGHVIINNSNFTNNSADYGGAIKFAFASAEISNSNFTDNTANECADAIYNGNGSELSLSNNNISSTKAEIVSVGTITSTINVVVLDNTTKIVNSKDVVLYATVTDDNGNLINDTQFSFVINDEEVKAVYYSNVTRYEAQYALPGSGNYVVNFTYVQKDKLNVKIGILRNIKGTYTDLAAKIEDAIANHDGVLNLTYDFAYNMDIDFDEFTYEGVLINRTLTINGNNHTISGSDLSNIFQVNVTDGVVTFNNITFADSHNAINTSSELIINDCTFVNNVWGGAIYSYWGGLTITGTTFANNTAIDGAAILISGGDIIPNVTITRSVFTNNTGIGDGVDGADGGAITTIGPGTLTIDNCVFTDNTATTGVEWPSAGGAISTSYETVITNSKFSNNTGDDGGAISIVFGPVEISNSTFTNNTASEHGGAIYNLQSITNIRDCTFEGNKANEGSAIYNSDGSELSLSNNNVSSTKAEIVSDGTITSEVIITSLNNETVPAKRGDKLTLTAKVTDDNGNLINDDKFQIVADGVALPTEYNNETGLYEANYPIEIGGRKIVNMTYPVTDKLTQFIGILDVPKENATLIVTVNDIIYGENATVTVELYGLNNTRLNETFTVIVNNTEYNVTTVNGTATFNVTDLVAGLYSAVAQFSNDNYNKVINSTIFAVKAETVLTINVENIIYGQDAIIEATLTDKAGNNVTDVVIAVTVDGKTYNIAINNGKGSINVTGLATGDNYNASAVFEGDINYSASNASDLFNVSNAAVSVSADVPGEALEGDNVTVTVTVDPSDATGEIKVYVDGKEYGTFNVGDEIIIEDLTNGTHIVGVQYTGDDNYNASEIMNYSIRVKVNLTESDVLRLGSICTYGFNSSVIMEIFYEDATGNVTVILDDVPYTGVLDHGEVLIMLPVLDVGDYDELPFIYSGDDKYTGVNTYVGVFVLPIDTEVVVTPSENNTVGDVANVTVTVVPKFGDSDVTVYIDKDNNTIEKANDAASVAPEYPTGSVTIVIDGIAYDPLDLVNGTITMPVSGLAAGNHTVSAYYDGDEIFTGSVGNNTLEVTKVDPEITISDIAGNVGDTVDATVTIAGGDATGLILFDGRYYVVENGQTTIPVTISAAGMQTINVTYIGDDKYNNGTGVKAFNAGKGASSIELNGTEEIFAGQNVTIAVTVGPENATGTVNITVDGIAYGKPVAINNGVVTLEIPNLSNGTHVITAQYNGNNNYNASEIVSLSVVVNKANVTITVEGSTVNYGENATVTVTGLPKDAEGTVNVTIIGVGTFNATVEDGSAVIEIPGLGAGTYEDLAVMYSGDDKYNAASGNANVYVNKITSSVAINFTDDVVYPGNVEIDYTVVNETQVTISVRDKDGNSIEYTIVDGKIVLTDLTVGKYTVNITNAESDNVSASSDEKTFNVLKATITIIPEVEGDLVVGGKFNVTFTLPDDIDGTVEATIDGNKVSYSKSGNEYVIPFDGLKTGNHTVVVTLTDDTNYENAAGQTTFVIAKAEPNVNVSVEVGTVLDDVNVTVNVPEDATGYVLIKVDDKPATFAEIENGVAKAAISDLGSGPHNLTVIYPGDENYANDTCSTSFDMEKAPTNTTINVTVDGFDVEIRVNVNSTEVVDGGMVTLTFNNKNTTATVVEGVAVFKFKNLDAKNYSIVASYEGNNKFLPSNATGSVKLVRIATYIKPVYKPFIFNYGQLYKFRLVDKEGNGIAGKTIEFSVHSKVYYVKTGKDGWGQIQLTTEMLIHADKIFSRLIFRGDTQYKPSTYAVWFNAMKEPSKFVDVKPVKASYKVSESNKQITATLKDSKDKGIGGKQVSINIGGKTITAKTNSKGVVTFNVGSVKLNVGSNAFTLLFEDVNYKKASYWGTINIVKD